MSGSYAVRRAVHTDDVALHAMHAACFRADTAAIDPTRGHWFVAFEHRNPEELVAFCGLTPTHAQPGAIGYLKRVGVLPGHRGAGLQRRLVEESAVQATRNGWSSIIADTTDNPISANNLIACGYRIYKPAEPWGITQTIYWRKLL